MKMGIKSHGVHRAYTQEAYERFRKKKLLYILLTSCIFIIVTVQAALLRFTEPFPDSLGTVLIDEVQQNCITQVVGSSCMIILQIIIYGASSRSPKALRLLRICRLGLQLGYIVFFMKITVVPLANSGNNSLMAFGATFFIELLFLNLGFLAFEPLGFETITPFIFSNVLFILLCRSIQLSNIIPFVLLLLMAVACYIKNHKIEKKLFDDHYSIQHNGEIYQTFLNLLPEGVAILTEEHELKYANSSLHRILACSEDNILNRLLNLGNIDAQSDNVNVQHDFVDIEKGQIQKEFQRSPETKLDDSNRKIQLDRKSLFMKSSLQPEDLDASSSESNIEMYPQELPKLMAHQNKYEKPSKPAFNRAKTYDITNNKNISSLHSMSEIKGAAGTFQIQGNSKVVELLNTEEKERSDDKESILRSARNVIQNQMENHNSAFPNLVDQESERPSEENKYSGNVSPEITALGQKSFIRKKTFQLEKKLTSEISFVGPMRATQLGHPSQQNIGFGVSHSHIPSQSSNYKIPGSAVLSRNMLSGELTPKSMNARRASFDNAGIQKVPHSSSQKVLSEKKSSEKIQQGVSSQNIRPLTVTKKFKSSKTTHVFQSNQKSLTTQTNTTFGKPENKNFEMSKSKGKKLTSYVTTLKDMRMAYGSIMRRLKEDKKAKDLMHNSRTKGSNLFTIFNNIKNYFFKFKRRNNNNTTDLPQTTEQRKEEDIRLNIEEEDHCIVMNSKLKISESKERSLEIKLTPTLLNNAPYILVLVKDTTERDLINRLKETNDYKNTIMASVSHELKTPLNCILAMQEMLRQYVSEELASKYLNPAINSSKLLMSLVNDILDFGQICAGMHKHCYEIFSLKKVLKEALILFEIPCKNRDLELKFEWDPKIPRSICSDPTRIRQIVINLLNNAIKFTYKGSITLKAISKGPKRVCITVMDTGVGIKAENVKKIFSAFGKMDNDRLNSDAVGLGLTISQSLAHRLGPKDCRGIKVQSEFGKGSCFYFTIESRLQNNRKTDDIKDLDEEVEKQPEEESRTQSQLEPQEEKKEEVKEQDLCEVEETLGDETMRPGFNMVLFNRMVQNVIGYKTNHYKGSFQSKQSMDSQNYVYRSSSQEPQSPEFTHSNIHSQKQDDFDITPVHQQRALDVISLQLNNSPLRLTAQNKFSSPLNFSFQPQNVSNFLETENRLTPVGTAFINMPHNSSHIEVFSLSAAEIDQTKTPTLTKTKNEIENVNSLKVSEDLLGKNKFSSSHLKSKDTLPVNTIEEKTKASKELQSIDFLKVVKSSGDVNQITNSPTNISTKISKNSSFLFQNQKNCSCEDILIVDDNDFNLLALRQILESLQFGVNAAHNGQIAIDMIKQKAKSSCCKSFQMVFMDCDMPVKDGFETTKELRNLQKANEIPYFPIIAATAFVNEREVNRCFECGMNEYMNKPVKKEKILEMIKKYCKK